jgi:hypothetical protein
LLTFYLDPDPSSLLNLDPYFPKRLNRRNAGPKYSYRYIVPVLSVHLEPSLRYGIPYRYRTGTVPVPYWYRTGTVLVPYRFCY